MTERFLEDVLPLPEAAVYLRVSAGEVLRLAEQLEIPRDFREFPPWFIDHPVLFGVPAAPEGIEPPSFA